MKAPKYKKKPSQVKNSIVNGNIVKIPIECVGGPIVYTTVDIGFFKAWKRNKKYSDLKIGGQNGKHVLFKDYSGDSPINIIIKYKIFNDSMMVQGVVNYINYDFLDNRFVNLTLDKTMYVGVKSVYIAKGQNVINVIVGGVTKMVGVFSKNIVRYSILAQLEARRCIINNDLELTTFKMDLDDCDDLVTY